MLLRVIRTRVEKGRWREFEEGLLADETDVQGISGLRARWLVRDVDDPDAGFIIVVWDSEADTLGFERDSQRHKLLTKPLPGEFEFHLCETRSSWIAPNATVSPLSPCTTHRLQHP